MDNYARMCDCEEIQRQRKSKEDSKYYVKENIWGFDDEDIERRKKDAEQFGKWYAKKYPEKPPYKQNPLLKCGETVIATYPLGEYGDNDCAMVYIVLDNYPDKFIWLPRQEEIQEMLRKEADMGDSEMLYVLYEEWHMSGEVDLVGMSLNEIWLRFYMRMRFDKT